MSEQFQYIIMQINEMGNNHTFTSADMKKLLFGVVKNSAIYSFLSTAHKMGVLSKAPVEKRVGRGPKVCYTKVRSLKEHEIKKLTTYPDCINFKKEVDAAYEANLKKAAPVVVKKHTMKLPKTDGKVKVVDHKDKTVITIFK